jgi:hypothetical protein
MKAHSRLTALGVFTVALILLVGQSQSSHAQGPSPQAVLGTGFTYQGQLNKSAVPVNDTCSFTFSLWDAATGIGQVGASQTINSVTVAKGVFTVLLNGGNQFGASAFTGQARWLQTSVKCTGDSSPVTLSRQQLTAAPYALFASAPWVTRGNNLSYTLGNVGIGTTTPAHRLSVLGGPFWTSNYWLGALELSNASALGWQANNSGQRFGIGQTDGGLLFFRTASNPGTTTSPATYDMMINDGGNVGIGTTTPSDKVTVQTSPESYGLVHTDGTAVVGTWVGTGGTNFESGWFGTKTNHPLRFFTGNGGSAMSIATNGDVLIGFEPYAGVARLFIKNSSTAYYNLITAENSQGNHAFVVSDDGGVWIRNYLSPTTSHVCRNGGWLATCASAAEYVPSVNSGSGFPETADLVSIAPAVTNPYGDTHAPFAVQKSSTACDPNLLGFIVNPTSGADGEKKN